MPCYLPDAVIISVCSRAWFSRTREVTPQEWSCTADIITALLCNAFWPALVNWMSCKFVNREMKTPAAYVTTPISLYRSGKAAVFVRAKGLIRKIGHHSKINMLSGSSILYFRYLCDWEIKKWLPSYHLAPQPLSRKMLALAFKQI